MSSSWKSRKRTKTVERSHEDHLSAVEEMINVVLGFRDHGRSRSCLPQTQGKRRMSPPQHKMTQTSHPPPPFLWACPASEHSAWACWWLPAEEGGEQQREEEEAAARLLGPQQAFQQWQPQAQHGRHAGRGRSTRPELRIAGRGRWTSFAPLFVLAGSIRLGHPLQVMEIQSWTSVVPQRGSFVPGSRCSLHTSTRFVADCTMFSEQYGLFYENLRIFVLRKTCITKNALISQYKVTIVQ